MQGRFYYQQTQLKVYSISLDQDLLDPFQYCWPQRNSRLYFWTLVNVTFKTFKIFLLNPCYSTQQYLFSLQSSNVLRQL